MFIQFVRYRDVVWAGYGGSLQRHCEVEEAQMAVIETMQVSEEILSYYSQIRLKFNCRSILPKQE